MSHLSLRPHLKPPKSEQIFVAVITFPPFFCADTFDISLLLIVCALSNVVITSVYKPPAVDFKFPHCITQVPGKAKIIIGDFNNHSTQWGYKDSNKDGDLVEDWMDSNQLSHIHDPKLPSSFHSARWKSGYNPDLVIVTSNIADLCQKIVTDPIPASQHWPIGIQVNAAVRPTSVPFRRRLTIRKLTRQISLRSWKERLSTLLQCQATMTGLHYW